MTAKPPTARHSLPILNADSARFECVFPTCGGACCKQSRPPAAPGEVERITELLPTILGELRPSARRAVERRGFLTKRKKSGHRSLAVDSDWCVFFNEGCVLHRAGAREGDAYKYKPFTCIVFPLDREPDGTWYVRQHGVLGEEWDVFCLNPNESPKRAIDTLGPEIALIEARLAGEEAWRRLDERE